MGSTPQATATAPGGKGVTGEDFQVWVAAVGPQPGGAAIRAGPSATPRPVPPPRVAGFFSQRMAKTALPVASAAIVANRPQGLYLHARGIAQKPGGWSNARYSMEMGPPLLAPQLVTIVGRQGLLAAILRREQ
jgi:hypothetical protein